MRRSRVLASGALALLALVWPEPGESHLFHFANVRSRETQVARDFRLIKELTQWGTKDFDLAAQVYRGELRSRERRVSEPGYLLKAEYQSRLALPPLKALVQAMDRRLRTSVDAEVEAALACRDEAGLEGALRKFFFVQIQELLEVLQGRLDDPEVASAIFGVLVDYLFTSYEVFLALNRPTAHRQVKDAVERLRGALPQAEPPKAAAPEDFERSRRRVESLLRSVTPMP